MVDTVDTYEIVQPTRCEKERWLLLVLAMVCLVQDVRPRFQPTKHILYNDATRSEPHISPPQHVSVFLRYIIDDALVDGRYQAGATYKATVS